MVIKIERKYKKELYTIGKLYVNGAYLCDTLEDTERELNTQNDKVKGKTAIPKGEYRVNLTYSDKFKKYLPLIENVKYFTGIRIHAGNTPNDTEGCILVGYNTKKGMVTNSNVALKQLMEYIYKAIKSDEPIALLLF